MEKYKLSDLFEKPISGEWGNELEEGKKGTRVLRTTNFTNIGRIDFSDVVERDVDLEKYSSKILKKGDIIIEKSGGSPTQPVGRVIYFDKEDEVYLCNNFTAILRPNERIYPKFALYLMMRLHLTKKVMKFQNKTTGIINLKLNDYIETTKVNIPSIETQKKIVEVLDKAQYLIDKKKEQIDLLDELVKSRFIEMFSNLNNENKLSLGDCTNFIDYRGKTPKLSEDGNIRMINAKSVGKGVFKYIDEYISEETYNSWMKRGFPNYGDILFVTEGHTFGNTCMIPKKVGKFAMGQRVITIQGNKGIINNSFLYQYMQTLEFKIKIDKYKTGSSAQGIRSKELQKILVPIPPIELQNEFAEFVTKVDSIRSKMEASLSELEDNFNSLMQKAFKGELF